MTEDPGPGGRHRRLAQETAGQPDPPRFVIHGRTGSVRWQHGQIVVSGMGGGQLTAPVDAVAVWLVDVPRERDDDIEFNLLAELGGQDRPSARTFARVLVCFPPTCRGRLQGFVELLRIEQGKRRLNALVPIMPPHDKGYPALPVGRHGAEPARVSSPADDEWVTFQTLTDVTGFAPPTDGRRSQSP